MMFCPTSEAQGRGRNNGGGNNGGGSAPRTENRSSNSGNSNRGNSNRGNSASRPSMSSNRGNNNNSNRNGVMPGNNNNRGNVAPATGGNRPGGNMGIGNARPGNGGWNSRNNAGHGMAARPGGGGAPRNFGHSAPMRPYMPAHRTWYRPTPPPRFRPYRGCPSFGTILGITLGSALDYTLDRLLGAGYNVLGYAADAIYLSNVSMFNYRWPNATMYYNDGALHGSEFTYSTLGYDRSRYTLIYNDLVRQYGSPVSVQNNGSNDISATWWGYDNRYVTLSYYSDYAQDGSLRYYTTLSFGN
jgi:hypothetical protein